MAIIHFELEFSTSSNTHKQYGPITAYTPHHTFFPYTQAANTFILMPNKPPNLTSTTNRMRTIIILLVLLLLLPIYRYFSLYLC